MTHCELTRYKSLEEVLSMHKRCGKKAISTAIFVLGGDNEGLPQQDLEVHHGWGVSLGKRKGREGRVWRIGAWVKQGRMEGSARQHGSTTENRCRPRLDLPPSDSTHM